LLSQKIMELNYEIQIFQEAILEYKSNEKKAEEDEGDKEEELELGEELAEDAKAKKAVCQPNKININTASFEDLQKIVGIGPSYAQKIISARIFCSLDDLLKVSGIGEKTLQKIKEQGCAYVPVGVCVSSVSTSGGGGGGGSSSAPSPQISLIFPQENPVNKEIEVELSVSNLKNIAYDVKISIEKDGVLSQTCKIYNQEENWQCPDEEGQWQNSLYYLNNVFIGPTFAGDFRLKIKDNESDFRGEADIIVKIRDSQTGTVRTQWQGKINIIDPEKEPLKEYTVTFEVKDGRGEFIEGVEVNLIDFTTGVTDELSVVIFENISVGTYNYTVSKEGYLTASGTVEVVDDNIIREVILEKLLIIDVEQFGTVIHGENAPPPEGWESTGTVFGSTTGTHNRSGSALGAMSVIGGAGGDLISPFFDFSEKENISVSWWFRGTKAAEGGYVIWYYSVSEGEWIEKYRHNIPFIDEEHQEYSVEGIDELNGQSNVRFKWEIFRKGGHNSIDDITITRQSQ